jgi:uncharacterized protein YceK
MRAIIVAFTIGALLSGCNDVYNGVQPTQVANVGGATVESSLGVAYVAVAPVSVVDLDEEKGE